MTLDVETLPLHGLKVLDFSRVLAGPFCSAMLADAGAEVVKIEPFEGDDYRQMGLQVDGRSANFAFVNRGKRSVRLNLKQAGAQAVIARLARWADVAIENFTPGVADRLGIGYATLSVLNPGLVYCSISGFGQEGPWAKRPAYDTIIQALSGLMDVTGAPDGEPTLVGESVADVAAGMFASWGVMAALWQRERTGRGRHLDVPMYDCLLSMMPTLVSRVAAGAAAARVGNRHANSAPFGAFRAADGLFVLAVANNRLFARLAQALGTPELAAMPAFATNQARKQHEAELAARIEAWAATLSAGEAVRRLAEAGVPAAPVLPVAASLDSEHARERGLLVQRQGAGGARECHVEQPVRFGAMPRGQTPAAPELGADTAHVLGGLGFDTAAIDALRQQGVI
ncbi:Acetyl-CoA:oxalate CoA-transferase [Cupriavidus yeoncheonensis]|uniref:Acetyl-CoA:oxalate CoA-transferase n=1 Tax=Cupriavidus yeoncheonensis TaxID=1462994 RepID=A0A916NEF3_9BURK|nr:CoA transferase [Cupriavidus yeoncheonensis]CAG2146768.1 Acetyl-CoA:oxalate CoA-transferase [Cupriavidus yeoncheonensis]